MEANETSQTQEEFNETYFMIQSKNPNLTNCQPTILMTELQVSSNSKQKKNYQYNALGVSTKYIQKRDISGNEHPK